MENVILTSDIQVISGDINSGNLVSFTGQELISTGEETVGLIKEGLLASPNEFWSWILSLLKSFGLWCLDYRYVPVIIIVGYIVFLIFYNWLWSYLLTKLQKKGN